MKKKEGVGEVEEDCEKPTAASSERAAAAVAANSLAAWFGGGRRRRAATSTKIRRGLSVERGGEISTAGFCWWG